MKKKLIPLLLVGFVLAACQGGRYHHKVGNCLVKNGRTKIVASVWRRESVSDAEAKRVLLRACGQEVSR